VTSREIADAEVDHLVDDCIDDEQSVSRHASNFATTHWFCVCVCVCVWKIAARILSISESLGKSQQLVCSLQLARVVFFWRTVVALFLMHTTYLHIYMLAVLLRRNWPFVYHMLFPFVYFKAPDFTIVLSALPSTRLAVSHLFTLLLSCTSRCRSVSCNCACAVAGQHAQCCTQGPACAFLTRKQLCSV